MLGAPHRKLRDRPEFVPLHEASEADADVLVGILHSPDEWVPARGFTLAERLGGYAPARVWQRQPEESFDTPENGFVLSFLSELPTATEALPDAPWWGNVSAERQEVVVGTASTLRQTAAHSMWAEVDSMQRFPSASQMLLRREGYRDLLELWQLFHQSRRPLFEPLRHAIDVRDVATLYEMWVYFTLVEEIAVLLAESPVIELAVTDEKGLGWRSIARFGGVGELVYNQTFSRSSRGSYSVPLRPDFAWCRQGKADVVLDAKFRMDVQTLLDDDDDTAAATPKRADLYKMHTYRDALGVRAAVSVYPGTESVFYSQSPDKPSLLSLHTLLCGEASGIGAIPLRPGSL